MPSGAKRRKAAKKKKEKVGNVTNSTSSSQQGNGYSPKSHDDKDSHSDSGDNEMSSPAGSQEHGNPFSREEQEEKLEEVKGVSEKPQVQSFEVEIEKSEDGGEGDDEVETKEVDSESRAVEIECVKEPDVVGVKGEGKSFGGSEVDEKRRGFEPPQKEELSESNGVKFVEIDVAVEPVEEVVSLTKELIHDPEKRIVCQSVDVVEAVEVNPVEKTGETSGIDLKLNDREGDVLPPSNGTTVETSNGSERPVESHSRECSENQRKDIALARPTVRPTSWTSCCGLFDVLTGSNR